jgi:uncharacterized protein (DUF1697 family)
MRTHISLLRGINVGGHHEITMAALKSLYESLGLAGVTTYIRSGNVLFQSPLKNPSAIEKMLEQSIQSSFGFDVTVIIRSPAQLSQIVSESPFAHRRAINVDRLAVSFLKSTPTPERVRALKAITLPTCDEFAIAGTVIYLHCPDGFAKTPLTGSFFEKHLGVHVSARNWKTTTTLLEMCRTGKA